MNIDKTADIIIIGGGIAGAIAALSCAVNKTKIVWFAPKANFKGGIQISPKTINALKKLGVYKDLKKFLTPIFMIRIRDPNKLSDLIKIDLPKNYFSISRDNFFSVLHETILKKPSIIIKNTEIVSFYQNENTVECISAESEIFQSKILIGADGVNGITRKTVLGSSIKPLSNKVIRRSVIPSDKTLKPINNSSINLWMGNGWHLVTYPISNGEFINAVLVSNDLIPMFKEYKNPIIHLIDNVNWFDYPLINYNLTSTYHCNNIGLIGDASHFFPPHIAQGAAQTIYDGVTLNDCIKKFGVCSKAINNYSKTRRPEVDQIIQYSNFFGKLLGMSGLKAKLRNNSIIFGKPILGKLLYDLW